MTEPSDKDHLRTDVGFVIGMSAAAYDLQPTDLSDVLREAADVLDDGGYDAFFAVEPDGGAKRVQDQPWGTPDDE